MRGKTHSVVSFGVSQFKISPQLSRNDPMLNDWSGTAGATLVGLLFVVVTLGTGLSTSRKLDIAHLSLTPALYSFAGVLLQSIVVLLPWQSTLPHGVIFVVMGIGGLVYRSNAVRVRSSLHLRGHSQHDG
jgi:hypothetical protein